MKKKIFIVAFLACVFLVATVFLSINRAGGEIGFEATVNRVEDGNAYATVIEQDAGFLAKKLPESIMFETVDMDKELQEGDKISACYLSGTIEGQMVRVVSVTVITD